LSRCPLVEVGGLFSVNGAYASQNVDRSPTVARYIACGSLPELEPLAQGLLSNFIWYGNPGDVID
jgi:hypothetical protein